MAFFKAIRLAFALADLLRNPEFCVLDRIEHVMGQCTSWLVALHCTFLENSSHFSLLSPIWFAHELPRTWWLSASSSCAAMKQQSDGCHIVGFESVDDIGAPDFGVPAILGTAAEAARVGLPVVSEGSGRDRTAA